MNGVRRNYFFSFALISLTTFSVRAQNAYPLGENRPQLPARPDALAFSMNLVLLLFEFLQPSENLRPLTVERGHVVFLPLRLLPQIGLVRGRGLAYWTTSGKLGSLGQGRSHGPPYAAARTRYRHYFR